MNDIDVFEADLNGQDLRVAIVQARFNEEHCKALSEACITELLNLGVAHQDIQLVTVPGALEIGFALSQLAKTHEFDAMIALGAVIRGETYHFELVSNESASAITRISLDHAFRLPMGYLRAIPTIKHLYAPLIRVVIVRELRLKWPISPSPLILTSILSQHKS